MLSGSHAGQGRIYGTGGNKRPLSDLIGPPPLPCGLSEQPLTIVDPRGSPTAVAGNFGHWQCTDWTTSWPGRRRPSALSERLLQAQTDIGAALGCVKIAGLLKEIDGWTGFTRDFSYQRRVSWWSVNWKPRLSFLCSTARPLCCNTVRFLKRATLEPHGPGPPGAESGQRLKPASGSHSWCT